jgi:hypothetical protein
MKLVSYKQDGNTIDDGLQFVVMYLDDNGKMVKEYTNPLSTPGNIMVKGVSVTINKLPLRSSKMSTGYVDVYKYTLDGTKTVLGNYSLNYSARSTMLPTLVDDIVAALRDGYIIVVGAIPSHGWKCTYYAWAANEFTKWTATYNSLAVVASSTTIATGVSFSMPERVDFEGINPEALDVSTMVEAALVGKDWTPEIDAINAEFKINDSPVYISELRKPVKLDDAKIAVPTDDGIKVVSEGENKGFVPFLVKESVFDICGEAVFNEDANAALERFLTFFEVVKKD